MATTSRAARTYLLDANQDSDCNAELKNRAASFEDERIGRGISTDVGRRRQWGCSGACGVLATSTAATVTGFNSWGTLLTSDLGTAISGFVFHYQRHR